ncbi:heavy metal translocating P-type ATPase [Clostridium cochlearium]|jgi:Cd2+/Zn2+-exporting ATPase|uniref:heavy metal translocating P-type ATPase n=1 Tax=Clostridium cochlearium TaxID=1494 RepID=UPI000BBCD0A1|nr:heavy metal translocating P-type ATPase [Clostridium cochlearium]MBE6064543.1 cadmium-translocating P-type ATPase [Clostridium cochlearium]MBU5270175.1 cadmium-translocating P-type ATPase [Clostridium cochlearium]
MNNEEKLELVLEGLNCAGCSAKIEDRVNKLEDVESASINFANKVLTIKFRNLNKKNIIMKDTRSIVNKLEPHVKVLERQKNLRRKKPIEEQVCSCSQGEHCHNSEKTHSHGHSHDHGETKLGNESISKISMAIGIILAIVAFLIKDEESLKTSLFIVSYILVGYEIIIIALKNILRGEIFDENFLMAVATIGAIAIKEYPEAVAVMVFYKIGEIFQDYAVDHSRRSIANLVDIRPEFANVKKGENIEMMSPEEVQIGDIIIVKPGEKVPLDGEIIEGQSYLDTSILTGESVNRKVEKGDVVLSGSINNTSLLTIKVTKNFGQSAVSKILDLVENASSKKAPTENFITKFAKYYTPAVVFSALALAVLPPIILGSYEFSKWIYRALVFLVISCPCALVVSIPLGFFGGIGAASRNGILIKGGNYLEALQNVEIAVFDKTGTLTEGVFEVSQVKTHKDIKEDELIRLASLGESFSNHPIAKSIVNYYGKDIDKQEIKEYEEISGHGIRALLDEGELLVGNHKLMELKEVNYEKTKDFGTVVYVALNKNYLGYIIISDRIKEDSKKTIKELKNMGVKKTVMLTGDNKSAGERIGKELALDEVHTDLLPENKIEELEKLFSQKSLGGKLVFVGDGVNDAPVLARADIGIAMGGLGSDAAIEASDIVIMEDNPFKIIKGIEIAKKTKKIVWQNIIFSLGVKFVVLTLGALGFANMWAAVFADVGVTLIAVLNSMRTLK